MERASASSRSRLRVAEPKLGAEDTVSAIQPLEQKPPATSHFAFGFADKAGVIRDDRIQRVLHNFHDLVLRSIS